MKVTIVDYGIGNLHSIRKALESSGAATEFVSDMSKLESSECIVLPGVGAFGEAMKKLKPIMNRVIDRLGDGIPALGICIGMQILFERSEESPEGGLGFMKGEVKMLDADVIPQMGWNDVLFSKDEPIFSGIPDSSQFYFANSYGCFPTEGISIASTKYGRSEFPSAVRKKNTFGFQFHPEKSSIVGLKIIDNFVKIARGQ